MTRHASPQGLLVVALCPHSFVAGYRQPAPVRLGCRPGSEPTHAPRLRTGHLTARPCKRRNPRRDCIDQKVIFKVIPCEPITSLFSQASLRRTSSKYFLTSLRTFFLLPSVQQRRLRLVLAGWTDRGPGMSAAAAHYESPCFPVIIFIFYHRLQYCARKACPT